MHVMPALLSTLPVLPAGSSLTRARCSACRACCTPLWGTARHIQLQQLNARQQQRGGWLKRGAAQLAHASNLQTDVADVALESLLQVCSTKRCLVASAHA